MSEPLPVVLVPGLLDSARLYAEQIPALWRSGPVMVADHTRDDSMAGIARRVLAAAPPRFALVGLSIGGYVALSAALRRVLDLMAEEVGAAAFIRQQEANIVGADSRPMLGGIRVPTLVLVGAGDELTPPERAAEMASAIPTAREVRAPDCGHLSTLERPHEVTRALLAWLEV